MVDPQMPAHCYDGRAMGIRSALEAPGRGSQLNAQVRGGGERAPQIDADAMHIRGALWAQFNYQRKYGRNLDKHHYPALVSHYALNSDLLKLHPPLATLL